jgi:hypothetical protein
VTRREKTVGGSASIVIIAILFLALMATLGVVFYQNFIQKPESTKQTSNTSKTDNQVKTKTERVAFNNMIYAVDYPESGWDVTATPGKQSSDLVATNKSGDVTVSLHLSGMSEGLPCNTTDGLQISDYTVSSATAQNLVGSPLYLVEAIYDHQGGGYDYTIGLVPDSGDTHSAVGATYCDVAHVGTAANVILNGSTIQQPAVFAKIVLPKLKSDQGPASPDMQTIKNIMNSDDYKAAVKILESARKE